MNPLTQKELDAIEKCECPECQGSLPDVVYFRSRCHPQKKVFVFYSKATGTITIECGECGKLVVRVKVS